MKTGRSQRQVNVQVVGPSVHIFSEEFGFWNLEEHQEALCLSSPFVGLG